MLSAEPAKTPGDAAERSRNPRRARAHTRSSRRFSQVRSMLSRAAQPSRRPGRCRGTFQELETRTKARRRSARLRRARRCSCTSPGPRPAPSERRPSHSAGAGPHGSLARARRGSSSRRRGGPRLVPRCARGVLRRPPPAQSRSGSGNGLWPLLRLARDAEKRHPLAVAVRRSRRTPLLRI